MKDMLTVRCPDCGSELTVDVATGAVLEHKPVAPRARTVDLDRSHDLLRRQQEERDRRFQSSLEAQKQSDDILGKKFEQSLRRVRDNPNTPRPWRDIDLD